jgi:hypothetical protein
MGMRIGQSSASQSTQATGFGNVQQRQQAFKDLFSALQSGDLGAAQQAFDKVTQGRGALNANSPLAALGQALKNGDLPAAQSAGQTIQSQRAGHHHHAHHGGAGASPGAPAASNVVAPRDAGSGSLVNLTA